MSASGARLFGDVLTAAFGDLLKPFGVNVISYERYQREKDTPGAYFIPLSVDQFFNFTYTRQVDGWYGIVAARVADIEGTSPYCLALIWSHGHRPSKAPPVDEISLRIKTAYSKEHLIRVKKLDTVRLIKEKLQDRLGIPPEDQRLTYEGTVLEDYASISDYGIPDGGRIYVLKLGANRAVPTFFVDDSQYDRGFDFDFSEVFDGHTKYERGGKQYFRPCGWYRCALKVKGKYENDTWLGAPGPRNKSTPGEWPVSYHGTRMENCESISKEGYKTKYCKRIKFGNGIYSSPSIDTAALYAPVFKHEGKTYKVVFQNRVSTENLEVIPPKETKLAREYWLQTDEDMIRPYGICLQEYNSISTISEPTKCSLM